MKKQLFCWAVRGLTIHTPAVLISEETTAVATEDLQRSPCCMQTFTAAELEQPARAEKHNSGKAAKCGGGC